MGGYYTDPQEGPNCRYCERPLLKDKTCCDSGCVCAEMEGEIEKLRDEILALRQRAEAERLENKGLADEYRKLAKEAMDVTLERDDLRAAVTSLMQDASPEHWRRLRDLMGVDDEGLKKEGR
jgi:hypothetical protein